MKDNGISATEKLKALHISTSTVCKHIENIYRKLRVHNNTAAVQEAQKLGII